MQADPNEWRNLAGDPQYQRVVAEHRRWLPKNDAEDAPVSNITADRFKYDWRARH